MVALEMIGLGAMGVGSNGAEVITKVSGVCLYSFSWRIVEAVLAFSRG